MKNKEYQKIKWGIWAYFLLLIFEGALRKWVFPSLSTPILIIRDPIAIWLIYVAWQKNILTPNIYIVGMVFLSIVGIITALILGHGNIFVAVYGARILLIHFPLMFIIGAVFNKQDVIKIGKTLLWISIPMVYIIALQFFSQQTEWINIGVGGDTEGSGFSGALGYFRPSGTFSFTNGNTLFFSFLACFVIFFWVSKEKVNQFILIGATLALFASVPLSISRSLFFSVIITLLFTFLAMMFNRKNLPRLLISIVGLGVLFLILSQASFFRTGMEAFTSRFETASSIEGGLGGTLIERYLGGFVVAFQNTSETSFFGYGIGMGTNAGSQLLVGERSFLIAEDEWGRLIGEMGLLLGFLIIFIRLSFCLNITILAYKKIKSGDLLPWILLSFGLLIIPQGQWGVPTVLGFSTLIGGLILASIENENRTNEDLKK
ncbi:hypothetical protein [Maribacter stanieri]|uniref:hypothetical protein n=1 Tax=Maribacter stanieri TaxID=440514 RepID=UPI002494CBF3|nr:hypothetical protein [Maribacter stanieri]